MSSCVTTPTATQTELVTSTSQSVSRSTVITEAPDVTRTSVFTTCVASATATGSDPACLSSSIVTSVLTIPGGTITTDVPVTVQVPFTLTSFETLFGTSCTPITSDPPSPPPSPPPTTTPPPPPASPSVSISTPPPETFTSQSATTLPDGVVTVTSVIVVSSPPPVSVTTTLPAEGGQTQQMNDNSDSTNLGPIIGGAVGGFFGLIGIVAVIWFIMKRRSRWDDIFDKEEEQEGTRNNARFSLDVDNEPKPYQYGLVGHVLSPSVQSPPNSPPLGPTTVNQNRRPSASGIPAPLSLSPSFTTSGHSAPPSGANLSRPSSAGSTQPLWSAGQQGRSTNDFGTRPPSMHSHSHSSSITSPPTSFANWGNSANVTGTGAFMGAAALGGVAVAAAVNEPNPRRSGSPVSLHEPPRRLQLANATPPSAASSIYSPDNDHHRGISSDSIAGPVAGPSNSRAAAISEFDPYASSSIDTPLVQGHPGVTRTNTKGMVILDPPQREVRVAQDGGRVLMASGSGAGSSSSAGAHSTLNQTSAASSSRPEKGAVILNSPQESSSSQVLTPQRPTPQTQVPSSAPPAYEE